MVDLSGQHFATFFMELKQLRSASGHAPSHAGPFGGLPGDEQTYAALLHSKAGTKYGRSAWKSLGDQPNDVHAIVALMNWNSRFHAEGALINKLAHSGYRGGDAVIMVDRRLCGNCNKRPELEQNGLVKPLSALNIQRFFIVEYLPFGPPSFRKHVWTPADSALVLLRETPAWASSLIRQASLTETV